MLYEYTCPKGHTFERSLPVSEYRAPQTCDCGEPGTRILSVPRLAYAQRECVYDSPIDGRPITSWRQRQEDMKRHGCQEYDPGMKQDYERRIASEQSALESKIESTIAAEIERLPARKRETLHNELHAGAEATPVRGAVPLKTVRSITQ